MVGIGQIDLHTARQALKLQKIDEDGFDDFDRQYLKSIIYDFNGGPVGVDSLAASLGYERETLENVVEPYLIQQGFVQRTRTGRTAARRAYEKFGCVMPRRDPERIIAEESEDFLATK